MQQGLLPVKKALSLKGAYFLYILSQLQLHTQIKVRWAMWLSQIAQGSSANPACRQQNSDPVSNLQVHWGMGHKGS